MNTLPCEAADLADIGAQVLSSGARLRFRARGFSMHPLITDRDILIVEPVDVDRLRVGDILLFRSATATVLAHRLIHKETGPSRSLLIMRGDARPCPDQPVSPDHVLGQVVAIERQGRARSLERGWVAWLGWLIARLPAQIMVMIHRARSRRQRWKRARVRGA